jgi:hypothetical protein
MPLCHLSGEVRHQQSTIHSYLTTSIMPFRILFKIPYSKALPEAIVVFYVQSIIGNATCNGDTDTEGGILLVSSVDEDCNRFMQADRLLPEHQHHQKSRCCSSARKLKPQLRYDSCTWTKSRGGVRFSYSQNTSNELLRAIYCISLTPSKRRRVAETWDYTTRGRFPTPGRECRTIGKTSSVD